MRAAVLSPRIAGICAALLGHDTLRLYHDSALCKEPGAGRTPWHYDAHHFPLDSHDVISTWMPLQAVPAAIGCQESGLSRVDLYLYHCTVIEA